MNPEYTNQMRRVDMNESRMKNRELSGYKAINVNDDISVDNGNTPSTLHKNVVYEKVR
jgi:hypothetical protein